MLKKAENIRKRVEVYVTGPNNTILAYMDRRLKIPMLPGGGVDPNETLIEAAARELAEEAGWLAHQGTVIEMPEPYIFDGRGSAWCSKEGWDKEYEYAVLFSNAQYAPDQRYNSEGDGEHFKLISISKIFDETLQSLVWDTLSRRLTVLAKFRIDVLKKLYPELGHVPKYADW